MSAPIIFDRPLYAVRRMRAERGGADSFLVVRATETLAERLSAMKRPFGRALDLGSRKAGFVRLMPHADEWLRTSPAPDDRGATLVADEEMLPFRERSFDLIVSVLALHAVNDLPGALVQIRRALTPDGVFVASLFGGATLCELRRAFAGGEAEKMGGASPRVAPFADVRDLGALLQRAGFTMPVADVDRVSVHYQSFATLSADLRAMGETNALAGRRRNFLTRGVLAAALAQYGAHDADRQGALAATFDILYLTGRSSCSER